MIRITDVLAIPVSLAICRIERWVLGWSSWLRTRSSTAAMLSRFLNVKMRCFFSAEPVESIYCWDQPAQSTTRPFLVGNSFIILLAPYPFSRRKAFINIRSSSVNPIFQWCSRKLIVTAYCSYWATTKIKIKKCVEWCHMNASRVDDVISRVLSTRCE